MMDALLVTGGIAVGAALTTLIVWWLGRGTDT